MERTELLAPAGDFETALSAFAAGADAVYCGLADFSARAFAKNFSFEELDALIRYARADASHPRKVYVTFNTLLDEDQLDGVIDTLSHLEQVSPDALIVQDLGVARLVRRHFPGLKLHASTQLVAHNLEGVLALRELGFTRVVLARELSLAEIASIQQRCGNLELEVFIHGALCYSLSGLCLYGAMEKDRSGNRGKCPYCCRQQVGGHYPFSMKDLRLGEEVRKLAEAGVASLKIEGRMKSPLYVASVTSYYRGILDAQPTLTTADLETVFSRRTTELRFNGDGLSPIDNESLGHRGTFIGKVKKLTRDREGLAWLRFHTLRALERHDGLQFDALTEEGRHLGFGITAMRQAIARRNVFEVAAGEDVEVLVPDTVEDKIRPGDAIYCSMSNAVKRRFPAPSYRPSDYAGTDVLALEVTLTKSRISVSALGNSLREAVKDVAIDCELTSAKAPERTLPAIEKAFSKLGGSAYRLGSLKLKDDEQLFVPSSILNDLRRDLVERLDAARERCRIAKVEAARVDEEVLPTAVATMPATHKTLRLRSDQKLPAVEFDELVVLVNSQLTELPSWAKEHREQLRLATPVYTAEPEFNRLRVSVKRLIREGFIRWEVSDLATLRMLKQLGIKDITADWTLYAFNSRALAELSELGVKRFVASPENNRENLQYLAESGYDVEFLIQQSTPLFLSLHRPEGEVGDLAVAGRGGLYVTTRNSPRTFSTPSGVATRIDLSWDPDDAL